MSPTSPVPGHPRIGLVIARLMVADEDRGVRPFIVRINDGESMSPGIICKVLPRRAGSKMVDHSTTTFNHVHLPKTSLLGSLKKPLNERDQFLSVISRISVGTLAISTTMIPILKRCAFVAGKYSLRRQIKGPSGSQIPIISFRTQQGPILHALANIAVFEAWATDCTQRFCDMNLETRVRHGIATAFKAVLTRATQDTLYTLAERCGAQGLYEHNHIIESQLESRGISIAEGDTLTLCIRLASELLLGRYKLPPPNYPECLLAQHETSLFDECRAVLQNLSTGHRSQEFNHAILPKCQLLVESAGQRMAYEAALSASVPSELLAIYEAGSIRQDPAWYVEKCGITHEKLFAMECQALDAGLLSFDQLLDELDVEPYCTAPILSETLMEDFNARLRTYENKGEAKHSKDSIPQSRFIPADQQGLAILEDRGTGNQLITGTMPASQAFKGGFPSGIIDTFPLASLSTAVGSHQKVRPPSINLSVKGSLNTYADSSLSTRASSSNVLLDISQDYGNPSPYFATGCGTISLVPTLALFVASDLNPRLSCIAELCGGHGNTDHISLDFILGVYRQTHEQFR
ncbi:hypothetical protein ETB97_005965 [Aspergillus alliaceus]|uniref:Acyl-CoA oxidase C-alpha1 domain-containing protein n=1 Tax=Petromyces alliaceus TaxID=209559 RepID=A0A8H5ZYB7_PETAA|nr:hypothetical protein ETB97_005965 [Aspergillus burnettii]